MKKLQMKKAVTKVIAAVTIAALALNVPMYALADETENASIIEIIDETISEAANLVIESSNSDPDVEISLSPASEELPMESEYVEAEPISEAITESENADGSDETASSVEQEDTTESDAEEAPATLPLLRIAQAVTATPETATVTAEISETAGADTAEETEVSEETEALLMAVAEIDLGRFQVTVDGHEEGDPDVDLTEYVTYADGVLTVKQGGITISGGAAGERIVVAQNADITLNNVTLTAPTGGAALTVNAGVTSTITLAEGSENNLTGASGYAGLEPIWENGSSMASVTFSGSGTLNATGGADTGGAGIGGSKSRNGVYG